MTMVNLPLAYLLQKCCSVCQSYLNMALESTLQEIGKKVSATPESLGGSCAICGHGGVVSDAIQRQASLTSGMQDAVSCS